MIYSREARLFGIGAGIGTVLLSVAYVAALAVGLATLAAPDAPIPDPWFTAMEILILLLMPFMTGFMVAVHAFASPALRVFSLMAVLFMAMVAMLTSIVHFAILTLGRLPDFADRDIVFAFRWPSVAYALDILAWDVFFAVAMLCAAPVFPGGGLNRAVRWAFLVSGLLSFAGLAGVAVGDMHLRNIGIIGYVGTFPVAVALTVVLLARRRGEG